MAEALTDTPKAKPSSADEPWPSSTPSIVEERDPTIARIAGIAGVFFVLAGTFMWYWNGYVNPDAPPFRPFFIRLWWVLGLTGMFAQAFRDRDLVARRCYGLLGYALVAFGLLTAAINIANSFENPAVTAVVAGVVGLLAVIVTAAPFVRDAESEVSEDWDAPEGLEAVKAALQGTARFFPRWWATLKTSSRVQQATIVALVVAVLAIIVGYALLRINALPHATAGIVLGFLFLLAFSSTERVAAWRDAGIFLVGLVGIVTSLTASSAIAYKPLGVSVYGLPIELALAVVGIVFLGAFIGMKSSDSRAGHGMAMVLFTLGVLVALAGLARSLVPGIKFDPANLRVPVGFLSVSCGGVAAFVGATLAFDNRVLALTRRELSAYFYSPIAYIVFGVTTVLAWVAFWMFLSDIVPSNPTQGSPLIQEPVIFRYYVDLLPIVFCLTVTVPAITMRLISEEQRTGTLEVLLTAPVSEWSVVLSKFFASWVLFMLSWLPWLVFPLILRYVGNEEFDIRPIMSFYLGLGFMASSFLATGLFVSSLTRNQIIAFMLGFVAMALYFSVYIVEIIARSQDWSPNKIEVLRHVNYIHHLVEMVRGKIPLPYLLYHVSLTVFGLFLTVKVLEARKWR